MNTFQPVGLPEDASAGSRSARQRRVVAFTLIELLVVIAIIGVLAGLIVGLSGYAGRKMRESRIRVELKQLETAIESYHAKFGHYPKDNVVATSPTVVVNPVTNALFYELSGTVLGNAGVFRTREGQEAINAADIQTYFNVEGFVNSSTDPKQVKSFMTFKKTQYKELSSVPDVELLVVPVPWPLDAPGPVPGKRGLNPWRYVSTSPTNNPATFDLWAEYVDGKRTRIICNWSKDILEKQ